MHGLSAPLNYVIKYFSMGVAYVILSERTVDLGNYLERKGKKITQGDSLLNEPSFNPYHPKAVIL